MKDEDLYSKVLNELNESGPKAGLWAQSFADADGDENKAKARYIKTRVAQLKSEAEIETKNAEISYFPQILLILVLLILVFFIVKFQSDKEKVEAEIEASKQYKSELEIEESNIRAAKANAIRIYPFSDNIRVDLSDPHTKSEHYLLIPRIQIDIYEPNSGTIISTINENKTVLENLIIKDLSNLGYDAFYGIKKDELISRVVMHRLVQEGIHSEQSWMPAYMVGGISEISLPKSFLLK